MVTVVLFSVALVFYEPTKASDSEAEEPVVEEAKQEENAEENKAEESTEETSEESETASETTDEDSSETKDSMEDKIQDESTDDSNSAETKTTETKPAETTTAGTKTPENSVSFKISAGESSYKVAENLYRAGLIDNPGSFNTYLEQNGYDNTIHVGTFNIPEGSTYEQIANTISK